MINLGKKFDVIIIGAGASGLMCGISAGKRGRQVLIIDHNKRPGKKILVSGGGKCNFTNYNLSAENYISENPHFVKSALARYTQWDFISLISAYDIPFEDREKGQLFCKQSATAILEMLLLECQKNGVKIKNNSEIQQLYKSRDFHIKTTLDEYVSQSLVIATGGPSWPSVGATDFGYKIGKKFGHKIIPTQPGLVPLRFTKKQRKHWSELAGISQTVIITFGNHSFEDELLFTHTGISGPAVLQISNYWQEEKPITINFLPNNDIKNILNDSDSKQILKNFLKDYMPENLVKKIIPDLHLERPVYQLSQQEIEQIDKMIHRFSLTPGNRESIKRAEVTLGGIDTKDISSKTFESNLTKGLYFIGEVMDVTGWLGGYNLQWAWSSGYCAGLYV